MYEELKDMVKALKCNCFKIYPDKIMGTDSNIFPISYMSIIYGDFSQYESGMYYVNSKYEIFKFNSKFYTKEEYLYDNFIYPTNQVNSFLLKQKGEEIECLAGKKASDGLCITILDKQYLLSLCKGFIPCTKQDECVARIYHDGYSYIIEYIVIKKKFTMNRFVRHISLL